MDIEKINKLLDSKNLDNILLAIELSYELPFGEFDNLYYYDRATNTGTDHLYYRFFRNGEKYGFGCVCFTRYGVETDLEPEDIDITPENFKI